MSKEPGNSSPTTPRTGETPVSQVRAWTLIKWIACLVIVAFVARALYRQIIEIDFSTFDPHWGLALLAACAIALVSVSQFAVDRWLLHAYGASATWAQAATLSWIPALAKYVPGKVVAIASMVVLLKRYRIPLAVALSVALMADALAVVTGLVTGAAMFQSPQVQSHLPGGWVWCTLLIALGLITLYPPVFSRLMNVALKKLKREPLSAHPKLGAYALPVLAAFSQWVWWGAALWCASRAVAQVPASQLPWFIVIAAMSNTVAYLAFFSPGGIGVREILLYAGLDPIIGRPNAALVVIAIRLIQTVVEIVLAGAGVMILRRAEVESSAS